MRWFFELREQGFMVSVQLLTLKACEVSAAFRRRTEKAKDFAVRRFCNTNKISLRQVTQECQRPPEVLRREAIDFIKFAKPKVTVINCCVRFVINMDQTPIFFNISPGNTISQPGAKTVNGRTSLSATLQVIVAVSTVTASGDFLCPLVVFKGKPGARLRRGSSQLSLLKTCMHAKKGLGSWTNM